VKNGLEIKPSKPFFFSGLELKKFQGRVLGSIERIHRHESVKLAMPAVTWMAKGVIRCFVNVEAFFVVPFAPRDRKRSTEEIK